MKTKPARKSITRNIYLTLFILFSFGSPLIGNRDNDWQLLDQGQLVVIYAEKAIYRKEGSDRFFVHVRLQNRTSRSIGIDLSDYFKVVYPNQWGVHQEAQRELIDEGRIIPKKPNEQSRRKLLSDYDNHKLVMIGPGAMIDYYRDFNASTVKDVENSKGKYLIISMDGQISATDGKREETVTLEWQGGTKVVDTDVAIPFPVDWKSIPKDGFVITEHL